MADSLAHKLKRLGQLHQLSNREAAEKAGLSFGYMSRLHSGAKENPTLDALTPLARVYGTTPAFLRDDDPRVDLWAELTRLPDFPAAGLRSPATRARLVSSFAALRYPGHLALAEQAAYLGRPLDPVDDDLLVGLAELTGVQLSWLRLGCLSFLPEGALADWPDLRAFLAAYQESETGAPL